MTSQNDAILKALKSGESLTALTAVEEFGCLRLAARINDLRECGHDIRTTIRNLPNGKRIAVYEMGILSRLAA